MWQMQCYMRKGGIWKSCSSENVESEDCEMINWCLLSKTRRNVNDVSECPTAHTSLVKLWSDSSVCVWLTQEHLQQTDPNHFCNQFKPCNRCNHCSPRDILLPGPSGLNTCTLKKVKLTGKKKYIFSLFYDVSRTKCSTERMING